MKEYNIGQRWFSEAEPELGLGMISKIESKLIQVTFRASNELRTYGINSAPLKRVIFKSGEEITTEDGQKYCVDEVKIENNILFYLSGTNVIPEMNLKSAQSFSSPSDKIFGGTADQNKYFEMRYESYLKTREYQLLKEKALLGSKINLLPHQCYVVQDVALRLTPRVMLSDEVGLGKTIEAGLILKSLILQNRASSALIIAPESLVFQWWIEMLKKFNLKFKIISNDKENDVEAVNIHDGELFVMSSKRLSLDLKLRKEVLETSWDILIVDEAHQLSNRNERSKEYFLYMKELASKATNLLLLSATPEILGGKDHFDRLALLDPGKFSDYEKYEEDKKQFYKLIPLVEKLQKGEKNEKELSSYLSPQEISNFTQDDIIHTLIDRYGTGRVYFRNRRENMEKNFDFFPKRKLFTYPLNLEGEISEKLLLNKKINALAKVLNETKEKILVVCHSKNAAISIHKGLENYTTAKLALFHSEMSLMERDRQAAYFADDEGAQVLISTEVGSEGRNFEFASHLFLFDLPKIPDQLEQRIGRLDRIGQRGDVNIHVPYVKKTYEEILFRTYDEVFESFSKSPKEATLFFETIKQDLGDLIDSPFNERSFDLFLDSSKQKYKDHLSHLEEGQDILVDYNSYREAQAKQSIENLNNYTIKNNIKIYLEKAFDLIGVHSEELNDKMYRLTPNDNMKIPSYPGLPQDGLTISYERDFSLKRDDIDFMSFEHPLALGTLELFLNGGIGNATVVSSQGKIKSPLFEFIFRLEVKSFKGSNFSEFLPLTPLRVLLDSSQADQTKAIPKGKLDTIIKDASPQEKEALMSLPKDLFHNIKTKAQIIANQRAKEYQEQAATAFKTHITKEIERLKNLKKYNEFITEDDIENLNSYLQFGLERLQTTDLSFDAIRVILP